MQTLYSKVCLRYNWNLPQIGIGIFMKVNHSKSVRLLQTFSRLGLAQKPTNLAQNEYQDNLAAQMAD